MNAEPDLRTEAGLCVFHPGPYGLAAGGPDLHVTDDLSHAAAFFLTNRLVARVDEAVSR